MKRSRSLHLALMATTPLVLAGCDNPAITGQQAQDWPAVECSTAEQMRTDACRAELENVLAGSPRYGSQGECENELGGTCAEIQEDGNRVWVGPFTGFIAGYLLSEAIDEIGDAYKYKRRNAGGYYGGYRSPSSAPGSRQGADTPAPPPERAVTKSRSGFGSSSAARRSFGG